MMKYGSTLHLCLCTHLYMYLCTVDIHITFATDWSRSSLQTGSAPPPSMDIYKCLCTSILCALSVCKCRTETARVGELAGSRSHHLELNPLQPWASLLHWKEWCGISRYTTLSSSAQLRGCLQYCLSWWYETIPQKWIAEGMEVQAEHKKQPTAPISLSSQASCKLSSKLTLWRLQKTVWQDHSQQ